MVNSQGAKHLMHFLSAKRNDVTDVSFKLHSEADDFKFCDDALKVRPGETPYFDPLDGAFRIASHPHSNVATARKKTFASEWRAAERKAEEGKELWKFSSNYLEIIKHKVLTKAGITTRIPVFDLCAWLYRQREFPEPFELKDLVNTFQSEYHIAEKEFTTLFNTQKLDGSAESAKAFFTHVATDQAVLLEMLRNPVDFDIAEALAETTKEMKRQSITSDDIKDMALHGRKQMILQGPPGTGKTYLAKQTAGLLLGIPLAPSGDFNEALTKAFLDVNRYRPDQLPDAIKKQGCWTLVQFHPSYTYEDFVRGISAKVNIQGTPVFSVEDKLFASICKIAAAIAPKPTVLIIDEINRGDLSKVLGELVYGLEYRDQPISLQYTDGSDRFVIPSALYIIATMNTADRSIAHIDYAIRRRFDFIEVSPDRSVVEKCHENSNISDSALALFDSTTRLLEHHPQYALGHSYFLEVTPEALARSVVFQVLPLLAEYRIEGVLGESDSLIVPKWSGSKGIPFKHERPFELVKVVAQWIETYTA